MLSSSHMRYDMEGDKEALENKKVKRKQSMKKKQK